MLGTLGMIGGASVAKFLEHYLTKKDRKKALKKQEKRQAFSDLINSMSKRQTAAPAQQMPQQSALTSGVSTLNQTVTDPLVAELLRKMMLKI